MGLCFVGRVGLADFLSRYVDARPGPIIERGPRRGRGAPGGPFFYTLGQRHGLNVGGGSPYYVVGKDMARNEVYVSRDLADPRLWYRELFIGETRWLVAPEPGRGYAARLCHGGPPFAGHFDGLRPRPGDGPSSVWPRPCARATPGQSAVLYDGRTVVGGGIMRRPPPAG